MTIKRKISSSLRLLSFKHSFYFWHGLKSDSEYQVIEHYGSPKTLIIAPHPDDEALGCSGLISRFSDRHRFDVVYLFTGSSKDADDYSITRNREAREALEVMGVSDHFFIGLKDGSELKDHKVFTDLISDGYQTIICPNPTDPHPDHRYSAEVLAQSMATIKGKLPEIWLYEIWNPLTYFNRLVPFDWDRKSTAIEKYTSQLQSRDYLSATEGLNRYRSKIYDVGEHAEAFMAIPGKVFINLLKK